MTTSADAPVRPSWRFVLGHPAHFLAFGFGAGLSPLAPGTAGTLAAFPVYWLLDLALPPAALPAAVLLMFLAGVRICGRTGRALGCADHGGIVWDEITAFVLVLSYTPPTPLGFAAAFVLFRLFDVLKPFPIGFLDRKLKHGFGVMLDDLLAAAYSLLILAALRPVI